jgi:hypothetical protein
MKNTLPHSVARQNRIRNETSAAIASLARVDNVYIPWQAGLCLNGVGMQSAEVCVFPQKFLEV